MAISAVEQSPGRADFDAVAALRTIQPAAVSADDRIRAAIAGFDRVFAHPFVADARATLAEDAALRIVCDHRGEIFLGMVVFLFSEALFQIAPVERHLLQLALAAAIADRAVQGMIGEQELDHRTLSLLNLFALCRDYHAVGADDRAGGVQLWHLLEAHQAHGARRLQSEVGVVTERRNVETVFAAHVNQARPFRDLELSGVDGYFD